jgi:ribose/galactose isomerase
LFLLVQDSAHTSNSENYARKGQQELEHFRGVQELALSRAQQDRELSGFVFILVLDLDFSRADFISRPHRALRRDARGLGADILMNFSEDGGSGNGEAIVANKVRGIRCALCWSLDTARWSREHNDANILAIGQRTIPPELALEIVRVWLTTAFAAGRHATRVNSIEG